MLPLPPIRTSSFSFRRLARRIDAYTLWAFNPQHPLGTAEPLPAHDNYGLACSAGGAVSASGPEPGRSPRAHWTDLRLVAASERPEHSSRSTLIGGLEEQPARVVVVMGVSGVGKTTVAKGLSTVLGWTYAEGDAFHSEANVEKMAAGTPLTDEDRWPWLRSIGEWMCEEIAAGRSAVVTCSALRRVYRDLLREGRPEVLFCHLSPPQA